MTEVEPPEDLAASHLSRRKAAAAGDVVGDLLEEIRFYVSQAMWEEAQAAIQKCAALAPGIPELEELRQQVEKSRRVAPSIPVVEVVESDSEAEPTVSTLVFDAAEHEMAEPPLVAPRAEPGIPTELRATPDFAQPEMVEPATVFNPSRMGDAARAKNDDLLNNMVRSIEPSPGAKYEDRLTTMFLPIEATLGEISTPSSAPRPVPATGAVPPATVPAATFG